MTMENIINKSCYLLLFPRSNSTLSEFIRCSNCGVNRNPHLWKKKSRCIEKKRDSIKSKGQNNRKKVNLCISMNHVVPHLRKFTKLYIRMLRTGTVQCGFVLSSLLLICLSIDLIVLFIHRQLPQGLVSRESIDPFTLDDFCRRHPITS